MNKASGIGIKGVLTLFILIFIASYLIYSKFLTSDQPRISSKTLRQIEKGEIPQNASELLGNVDSSISPWTSLLLAKSQELLGQKENALSSYQSIPSDSAASLEAKLAIFRLDKSYRSGERINELESQLQKTKRTKLLKEIDLIRAEILIQNKSYPQALSALQELRSQKINTSVAKKAKKLFEKNKNKIINQTPAFKIREIETLISEGSYKEALGLIENLKNEFKNDNLYFKLLLKEESALRKQGKNIEADDLLLLIMQMVAWAQLIMQVLK